MAKDPVCGMKVSDDTSLVSVREGIPFRFCSELCKELFDKQPENYLGSFKPQAFTRESQRRIAYFSMEIGLDPAIPTYSGGLGILAGDTLKSCADLEVPVVGVTLLHRKGYFQQHLDQHGNQSESPVDWKAEEHLVLLPQRAEVTIEGRKTMIGAWRYDIPGVSGHFIPVIFLDTDLRENSEVGRRLTGELYGGDERYRLSQEVLLGIGGVRMLRALGYTELERFHMNEGHSALLVLELLRETRRARGDWDFHAVRSSCVFTTHTPVPAGHDQFHYSLVGEVLGETFPLEVARMLGGDHSLNMTLLALNGSDYVNGVAKRHGQVSREMFPGYPISSITNGIHSPTWVAESYAELFDRHVPEWRTDPFSLRYAIGVPPEEIWQAHRKAKIELIDTVNRRTDTGMDYEVFTVGFARRATQYKRTTLILRDVARLREIARKAGQIQLLFAGKAHPRDEPGKQLIREIFGAARELGDSVRLAYLEGYDMSLARLLVSGVDLWLNTPRKPMEASGTSGMKAAHNGVPSLSVLDGWWIEGHIEAITGWSIGLSASESADDDREAAELYEKLEHEILPLYYRDRAGWKAVMRQTIAFNASFFNTHRMVQQYIANAYF